MTLYLENNEITDESAADLAQMLKNKPNLKKFNLGYNGFTDKGMSEIL